MKKSISYSRCLWNAVAAVALVCLTLTAYAETDNSNENNILQNNLLCNIGCGLKAIPCFRNATSPEDFLACKKQDLSCREDCNLPPPH